MATDNKSIGRFILDGILPAPRGVPQIDVTFDIDANGILSVSAKDKGTGKEQKIVIQPSSGLSEEEIEQMVDEAKGNESEDQRRRAEIETRNQADSLVYSSEKMISDNQDKIPDELKTDVESKVVTLKSAIEANNVAEMQTAMADLNQAIQQVGQAVYSQASEAAPPDGAAEETVPTDDEQGGSTVEGEFREV